MRLHNYWWLLIWMFLFGAISAVFIHKREELVLGRKEVRWNCLPALLMVVPYIVWTAWRPDSFGDTFLYRKQYLDAVPSSFAGIASYIAQESKDKGFALLESLFKTFFSRSDIVFFAFIAVLQILCLYLIYRRYSRNYWLSMFLFVASTDYLSWMHNGMRQFLAVVLIFVCIPLIVRKQYLPIILVVILASQIHLSALVFLPFVFIVNGRAWNIRTILFIGVVIASTFFLDRITGIITDTMEDTVYSSEIEIFINDDGTNILRVLFYSIPAFMSLLFKRYVDAADDPLINVCVNLSVVAAGFYVFSFYTSGILIGRIPIYFSLANYILIPWLITEVFNRESAYIVTAGFVGVYSLFFYIQCTMWHLL